MSLADSFSLRRGVTATVLLVVVVAALYAALRPTTVEAVRLEAREVVSALAVVGRVRAPSRAGLGVSIAGTVRDVQVREGSRVESGDLLVVLDDREARAFVAEAEAVVAETRASTTQAIDQARREAELAQRDFERVQSVFREGGLTRQQVDQAENRAADAASRLEALQAERAAGGGEPAAVSRARASLEAARARLALTRVAAPSDGVILTRQVEPGDAVAPGRTLLEMAFDGPTELVVYPGEENLGALRPGVAATASADAFPDETFGAVVALVAPSVDRAQGTVEVRLSVPEPPDYLRPEMTVSVNIETGRKAAAMVLPDNAVEGLTTGDPWVGVVQDGRVERRPVQLGLRAGGYVEIVSGLNPDEMVIRQPEGLESGQRVRVAPAG